MTQISDEECVIQRNISISCANKPLSLSHSSVFKVYEALQNLCEIGDQVRPPSSYHGLAIRAELRSREGENIRK